mmetsp:Transcript_2227/g.7437  ORF Transcript_2227/g.7437 Transcript_2227/m.7437 type:complete len:225 (-) Transcript_2227:618-1292(-)
MGVPLDLVRDEVKRKNAARQVVPDVDILSQLLPPPRIRIDLVVEEVGDRHDKVLVPVAVNVDNGRRAEYVRVHRDVVLRPALRVVESNILVVILVPIIVVVVSVPVQVLPEGLVVSVIVVRLVIVLRPHLVDELVLLGKVKLVFPAQQLEALLSLVGQGVLLEVRGEGRALGLADVELHQTSAPARPAGSILWLLGAHFPLRRGNLLLSRGHQHLPQELLPRGV